MAPPVIAKESVVVHDDLLGIDRHVFAGQPVPADLVGAYNAQTVGDDAAATGPEADAEKSAAAKKTTSK